MWKEAEMINIRPDERKETRNISVGIIENREEFRTYDLQNMKEKCRLLHLRHFILMSELTTVDSVCNSDPERKFHSWNMNGFHLQYKLECLPLNGLCTHGKDVKMKGNVGIEEQV
jgi:hypothetical protein